ncbi:hypothetical protein F0562_030454 [Nyssa sinensis]|uniref:Uncharacterized protein n=1 Tax=Nyssa sinensis TaxID=561372 RepID=A0A5J5B2T2_9ASTE|nr:hypothetical protein F0562_030454 [Nyssa sinensis]
MASVVHKKNLKIRSRKKLFKKVVDYLRSDSYMFAPLISSRPSHFPSTKISFSATGIETTKPIKENNKKLLKKFGDYLKSDCFMYAPLVVPQPSHCFDTKTINSPHTGPDIYLRRVTTTISVGTISRNTNQPTEQTENVIRENRRLDDYSLNRSTVARQTRAHREMVKHMVDQNCRSSSVSGKRMLKTERRKLVE